MGKDQNKNTKKSNDILELILEIPEFKEFNEFFLFHKEKINSHASLLNKFSTLSLKPQTIFAGILFILHQNEEDLEKESNRFFEGKNNFFFLEVILLYRKLNKVYKFNERPKSQKQVELTLRMYFSVLGDVHLITVLLLLQLQKLEETLPKKLKDQNAWDALNIYAPLAGRLGIFWIKSELEDKAFRHLEYNNYQILKKKIARKSSSRAQSVDKIVSKINSILKNVGLKHNVYGRYKRFYSIYQKLEKVGYDFEKIQDLIAFRIVVNTVDECYKVLSFIHDTWTPLKNRFKDYIVKPKPNGYQSLHTTVQNVFEDNNGVSRTIEIQIRTQKMHQVAEFGVAAHWLYKERRKELKTLREKTIEASHSNKGESRSFEETIPFIELYREKIYLMTPKKEIIELPKDATPIDFAYAIHTDVGNRTTGAIVNGKIIKLDGKLNSGDILEVLTSPKQEPKKEWLEIVKTRHARNKINHALHEQNRASSRRKGLELLEKQFKEYGLNLNRLIRDGKMDNLSRKYKNQEFEHVIFCIGEGTIKIEEILDWFEIYKTKNLKVDSIKKQKITKNNYFKIIDDNSKNVIIVDGMKNVMNRIARCCCPEKNNPIIGYITKEKVVTIHRESCVFLKKLKPERIIKVSWSKYN